MIRKITFVVTVATIFLLSSCGPEEKESIKRIRPVKSMIIGDIGDVSGNGFPGVTKEYRDSEMSFRVDGPIIKYNVVEGAQIKKGALIAEIDPRDYKVTLLSAKARYDQAKSEADRFFRLWKKGSVSKNAYERRFANYLEAEAAWQDAKNALNDTKLYAPYTGFFGPKLTELGEEVRRKQAIATIVDLSVVEVITIIPEQLAIQILNFDKYEVRLETYPDIVFNASLKELEKKPTPEGFPLHLFLEHVNNQNDRTQVKVAAGMSCRVKIIMKTSGIKNNIIIPITAVFEGDIDDNTTVWLIDPDSNTVKKQNVIMGDIVGNDAIQIVEGLSNGQQIVVAGVHRLNEGDQINILETN